MAADQAPASRPPAGRHRRTPVLALFAGAVAFVAAGAIERWIIRVTGASQSELTRISDAILTTAFVLAIYLLLDLRDTRAQLSQLERQQIALDAQLSLAAEIQRNLLPSVPRSRGARWAARMVPAGRIGGDFYDFADGGGASDLVILGDVSGKGVPAALLMASTRTLFRLITRETHDPAEIVARLSRALYEDNGGTPYVTCLVARIDLPARRLTYVNAGHPEGLLLGPSGWRRLTAGGPPAGLLEGAAYEAETLPLVPGDLLILVTDGITEAVEGAGPTPTEQVGRRAATLGAAPPPERVCDELMSLAQQGRGPVGVEGWQDDRTVVTLVVDAAPAAG